MRTKRRSFAVLWSAMLVVAATAQAYPARAADKRIVTVGGDVTEIVFALGRGAEIVAVDTTSLYPPEVLSLPKVGYMRALSSEGVLSLMPDLILANAKAGPPPAVTQIRASGVPFIVLSEQIGFEPFAERVSAIGAALERRDAADALVARLHRQLTALGHAVGQQPARPKVLFLLTTGERGAPLASGMGTVPAAMIDLAGGTNAVDAYSEYQPLTPEAAVAAAPDYLLVASHTLDLAGGRANVLKLPQVALTPAARAGRLVEISGDLLSGFGPRTPQAIAKLFLAFHPGASLPADVLAELGDR